MKLKVVVNNYTDEEKELKQLAKLWVEKQRARQEKAIAKEKTTD